MAKVLIYAVEDDDSIMELYKYALNNDNYECVIFESAEELFTQLDNKICDIILLDIMLPTIDGYDALKILKSGEYNSIPVIIVSAKNNEMSKVKGLDMGANDYIAKPFGVLELIARINANINKSVKQNKSNIITYGDIVVYTDKYEVYVNDKKLVLTNKEYSLLVALMNDYGRAKSRENLLNEVWGYEYFGETRTVDMHIKELRNKLAKLSPKSYIHTIRSIGYIFEDKEQTQ